jgi:Ca2+-binding RTX toxin-like protein
VTVNLTTGTGIGGNAQGDTLTDIENLVGSYSSDVLIGNAVANVLIGSNGNDMLRGALGADTLTGGIGSDRFVYGTVEDSIGATSDLIADFNHAQGDLIDLSIIDANTGVAGDQGFTFLGTAAFTHHAGELRYASAGGQTILVGDVDGDAVADMRIVLAGTLALAGGDFVL